MLALGASHDGKGAIQLYNGDSRESFGRASKAVYDDNLFNVAEGKKAANSGAAIYGSTKILVYGALAVAALLCAVLGWLLVRGVSTPIQAITTAMQRLARHDLTTEVVGRDRKDEIGAMAGAVQVFKESMLEADRLAEQQRGEQAQKEKRAQRIEAINAQFDRDAARALDVLSGAADEDRKSTL